MTIAALRGLRAADPRAIELMRSLAAARSEVLWKVRLPAAAPYLFTAFKIAAPGVGRRRDRRRAAGRRPRRPGRALLNFNQYYTIAPERLWAAFLCAAAVGIICFLLVVVVERIALRGYRPPSEPA